MILETNHHQSSGKACRNQKVFLLFFLSSSSSSSSSFSIFCFEIKFHASSIREKWHNDDQHVLFIRRFLSTTLPCLSIYRFSFLPREDGAERRLQSFTDSSDRSFRTERDERTVFLKRRISMEGSSQREPLRHITPGGGRRIVCSPRSLHPYLNIGDSVTQWRSLRRSNLVEHLRWTRRGGARGPPLGDGKKRVSVSFFPSRETWPRRSL